MPTMINIILFASRGNRITFVVNQKMKSSPTVGITSGWKIAETMCARVLVINCRFSKALTIASISKR